MKNNNEPEKAPPWADKGWEAVCRVLFGRSIGGIEKYSDYLQAYISRFAVEKSLISGREIAVSGDYRKGSAFISGDEMQEYQNALRIRALDINQIKDIDSVIEAVGENFIYSGSKTLGNSSNALLSDRVMDSNFIYKSHNVSYSKNIAFCYLVKYSEYAFGGENVGKGAHFAVRGFEIYESSRLFECLRVYSSNDCFYCANLDDCSNCLFSFNLRAKRRCIGNLQLPPDKFSALKSKLLGEIAQTLQNRKSAPIMMEIIGGVHE